GAFYQALTSTDSGLVKALFNQWEYTFGVVYGEETVRAEKDVPELARGYGLPKEAGLRYALFAVHTYFALIMKLIAAEVLSLQQGSFAPSLIGQLPAMGPVELKSQMAELEDGGVFRTYGVQNFLEGDFFRWYLDAWEEDVTEAVRLLATRLSEFEPTTPILRSGEARDLLKKLYQYLVPRKLRHDLGEYYTPDWIAERLLNQLGYDGNPDVRLLDPACGSGTFLTLAIDRAREFMAARFLDRDPLKRKECAKKILRNVVGFDLNPLAVIAARTNYLLAFGDFLRDVRPIEMPVYICDSVLTPVLQKKAQQKRLSLFDKAQDTDFFFLPTSAGEFLMPKAVLDKGVLGQVTAMIESCVEAGYKPEEFISRLRREVTLEPDGAYSLLEQLYAKILDLESKGRNGIWARLLKNSFAPVLQEAFDLVAGNPPWVNWESLAKDWRELSKDLWVNYGLFSLRGHEARLGGGKKDLAMLFTYACADYYLKPKGRLGFVITQTLFKTKGAGDGFRRFHLGEEGNPLRVMHVDDMAELQPFEGATNQTAILILQKGEATRYPVPYTLWRKKVSGRIPIESSLQEATDQTRRSHFQAVPVDNKPTSPWLTARPRAIHALQKIIGLSDYRAAIGACTWMNAVYWIQILERRSDNLIVIENLTDVGKLSVPKVRAAIEPDLLYPFVRGKDIGRWKARASTYFLMTQNPNERIGWAENEMKARWPHTYSYLLQFEEVLRRRSGYKKYFDPNRDPFWTIYNVNQNSLAPYKVMWRQMIGTIKAAVTGPIDDNYLGVKTPVTQHVVSFVSFCDLEEAHYFCALMNTSMVNLISLTCFTGKSFGTPGFMNYVSIPKADFSISEHCDLARLSKHAHTAMADSKTKESLLHLESAIDQVAADLWGISDKELAAIQQSLKELQ
ncbi:hypothetical protein HKBW3C_02564, partial [Candidatus Hakubella thermalkaliphila]